MRSYEKYGCAKGKWNEVLPWPWLDLFHDAMMQRQVQCGYPGALFQLTCDRPIGLLFLILALPPVVGRHSTDYYRFALLYLASVPFCLWAVSVRSEIALKINLSCKHATMKEI